MRIVILLSFIICVGCIRKEPIAAVLPLPEKEIIISGLNKPWSIAFLSEEKVLVTEKNGELLLVDLSKKTKEVVKGFPKDLTDSIGIVHFGDNSGMYEVITHPEFKKNQLIYLSYASKKIGVGRATKFVRAKLQADSLINLKEIFTADPFTEDNYHYGGGMVFGSDKKLYLTTGERLFWERDEPPVPIAQDIKDKRGKIFRFNDDGSIPKDNPDFGEGAIPGLYAIGLRNSQGIALQSETNTLWFTEHGTIQGDEINILEAGANYGWPNSTTGKLRSKDYKPPKVDEATLSPPTWFWLHTVAPTGLCFYTGNEFPQWKNNLFVPGLSRGSLWRFHIEGKTIKSAEELFIDERVRSRKVRQSPDGKLYLLTDEEDGKIIRIKPISK
ncbi:PQQ-dependent sugar dehydrogenase [Croceitalea rosinachiae]|uniref:PQQ-dependent sugar dehydrogenase n=1 Tax=Croceitalea rosinachiae TaxID=3075596 RepID=A0ABU3A7H1_9FLAO|nr:PQQ-dependent sugar dehydrogenase [Croceitalea sp. F388]MDT0606117.1 PQQ-dependent sugar dehydrogenase [Croceitalea sp. F388]